jgi:hypothetical protein
MPFYALARNINLGLLHPVSIPDLPALLVLGVLVSCVPSTFRRPPSPVEKVHSRRRHISHESPTVRRRQLGRTRLRAPGGGCLRCRIDEGSGVRGAAGRRTPSGRRLRCRIDEGLGIGCAAGRRRLAAAAAAITVRRGGLAAAVARVSVSGHDGGVGRSGGPAALDTTGAGLARRTSRQRTRPGRRPGRRTGSGCGKTGPGGPRAWGTSAGNNWLGRARPNRCCREGTGVLIRSTRVLRIHGRGPGGVSRSF